MRELFNMDNGFFRFMSKVADLCILNFIFILCCIPIVTIGASITAMSYVTLKMKDNEEGYILRSFFKSFRQNIKQSTLIWLILLAIGIILGMDLYILRGMQGGMTTVVRVVVLMGIFIWLMIFSYIFPLQARFYNTIRGTFRNAILLSLANLPRTVCMIALQAGAVMLTLLNGQTLGYGILAWSLIGFALISFANSSLIIKVIRKLIPEEGKEDPVDVVETEDDQNVV